VASTAGLVNLVPRILGRPLIHAFNNLTIHPVVEVYFHSFLTLTLDGGEISASVVDCFIPVTTEEAAL